MLREAYERAGREAHASGVPRSRNPFATQLGTVPGNGMDAQRRRALADYWWQGWDSLDKGPRRGRRG